MLNYVLDFLFPKVCGICDKICPDSLCKKCELKLLKCQTNKVIDYTNDRQKYFDFHLFLFKYEDIIRKKIIDYKFNEKAYLFETFSKIIINNEKICGNLKSYDIIIPVPMYKKKENKRGYNQSSLIAKNIALEIDIEYVDDCLIKITNNQTQSKLKKAERISNVKGVYKLNNTQKINNKNVILFDDIYTTGNTVNECCKLLKKAGAKKILVLTIAKD